MTKTSTGFLDLAKITAGSNSFAPPSSEIEQRVLLAKEAARSSSVVDSDRQYDYVSERMLPASVNQAMPILTIDQFSERKNTLIA